MYIDKSKNHGKDYLKLVRGVRKPNKNGDMVSRKEVILNIGPLDRFDDGKPNYLQRLRESFRAGDPLIPALKPYCTGPEPETYHFTIKEGDSSCFAYPKLYSQVLLERILEDLGLNSLFSSYKRNFKFKYDVYGFFKLLVFGKLINPDSHSATIRQNEDYYIPILGEHNPDNVYDTLDFVYQHKDQIMRRINNNLSKNGNRSLNKIFYNIINLSGKKDGLFDKMGFFIDSDGIPIALEAMPENTPDRQMLSKALEKSIDNLDHSHFVLVTDKKMKSCQNLLDLRNNSSGYLLSTDLLESPEKDRKWAFSEEGCVSVNEDFKYKSRIVERTVKDKQGRLQTFDEKVVVYWNRDYQKRKESGNRKFLNLLDTLTGSSENFEISSAQLKKLKGLFKDEITDKETGDVRNAKEVRALLDYSKVEEYKKSLGYRQIITSELDMNDTEVIDKYHRLTQVEGQFRVMKGDLKTLPMFLRNSKHITAYLLIDMIAFIMQRIIQNRITNSGNTLIDNGKYKSMGLSGKRIQKALQKWKVVQMGDVYYRFADIDDPDLKLILDAFDIEIPKKLFQRGELKKIKTDIKVFK